MKHLIIYAHPSTKSFSFLLKNKIIESSINIGYEVVERDLYEINFNPVLTPNDLGQLKIGQTPAEIAEEQKYLEESDLVTLIFPLWWAGFPAIMKGYIDKIFSYGFAYKKTANGIDGLLKGKKVMIHTSMGNSIEEYKEKDLIKPFQQTMGQEIFEFCGMEIVHHEFYPQIPDASNELKNKYAQKALKAYEHLWNVEVTN